MSRHRKRRELAGAGLALGAAFTVVADAQAAGVSNTNDSGPGSLRQAVLDTNASAMDNAIGFTSAVTGTITLTSGQLQVTDTLNILGPGADVLAISGNNASRVFDINPDTAGEAVNIATLTVRNGSVAGDGAGMRNEDADLTLHAMALVNNQATGVGGDGGGLYEQGSFMNGESTTVFDSTISGNTAGEDGGGVYGRYSFGGVYSTTVTGNTAATDDGGGLYAYDDSNIVDSTISNNSATVGSGGGVKGAGPGIINIDNTLIGDNTAAMFPDADGQVEAGFSLIENTTGTVLTSDPTGSNITGQDAQLGPLQNNGGTTLTRRPGPTSPALDKAFSILPATDQRGQPRIFDIAFLANAAGGNAADIGSVELTAAEAPVAPVTPVVPGTPVTPVTPSPKAKKCKKKGKKGASAAKCKKAKKKG